jgi:hypothetical protein
VCKLLAPVAAASALSPAGALRHNGAGAALAFGTVLYASFAVAIAETSPLKCAVEVSVLILSRPCTYFCRRVIPPFFPSLQIVIPSGGCRGNLERQVDSAVVFFSLQLKKGIGLHATLLECTSPLLILANCFLPRSLPNFEPFFWRSNCSPFSDPY